MGTGRGGQGRAGRCGRGGGGGGGSMLGYCSRNLSHNYCTVRSRSLLPSFLRQGVSPGRRPPPKELPRPDTNRGAGDVALSPAEIMEHCRKTREPGMLHEY